MNFMKKFGNKFLILILVAMVLTLTGCNSSRTTDNGDYYTVVYDGNGGYLGNKTSTYRKLQVTADSKIPKYLSEYTQDSYVVSSLGIATRQGYTLLGWYLEENAEYGVNPVGEYVYLSLDDGNGVYTIDEEGDFVYGYVEDAEGTLIYIHVEPLPEDIDPINVEYIYYNGADGYGFYVYNNENPDQIAIYEADGSYTWDDVEKYSSSAYLVYTDLSQPEIDLFQDVLRYEQAFYPYTEADFGLTRYSFQSGYIYFASMMDEDVAGIYVLEGSSYVAFDPENPNQEGLTRYSVDSRYVFTPSDSVNTPSDLTRYNASITYWDFENQRVTKDMVLIAHWVKKLSIQYIQKSGQVTTITQKLTPDKTNSVDLVVGELIGKPETIPQYADYTFVGWSLSDTEYIPWDFDVDVYPSNTSVLNLYGFMIEGTYTRITTVSALSKVALNPAGNYLLCTDIDLGGVVLNNISPLGFELKSAINTPITPFTGKFVSMGYSISNFTLKVQNTQKTINKDLGIIIIMALFPYVQNATIDGVIVENAYAILDTSSTSTSVVCDLGASGIVGTALTGMSTIMNCDVTLTFSATNASVIGYPVYVGDIIAKGTEYATVTNCTSTIDYSLITGITSSTLVVQILE
ncbi:MAG: InlB B-repeat-containing protein [Candidatus Izemoplasmatales bacterium]|nr:InlB B-repeat-containing protein [Candidatus Izemoplasmatales bacterium]